MLTWPKIENCVSEFLHILKLELDLANESKMKAVQLVIGRNASGSLTDGHTDAHTYAHYLSATISTFMGFSKSMNLQQI